MNVDDKAKLATEIVQIIIDRLKITHITAPEVNTASPLFDKENELGLDSIDGIEIVMALQQEYGVRITDQHPTREILHSIDSIVDFLISQNATKRVS